MTATVSNLDGFFEDILAGYPDFKSTDYPYLVEELDALQQLYFEKLHPEEMLLSVFCSSDQKIYMQDLQSESFFPEPCDIISVSIGNVELPIVDGVTFLRSQKPRCAFLDGTLCLSFPQELATLSVKLLCRFRPKKITYGSSGCVGALYIHEKHLPMVRCKMKECLSRSVGDSEDADLWAKAFNEWVDALEQPAAFINTLKREAL